MDYDSLSRNWKPWDVIPAQFNLGTALTRGQVAKGHGDKPAPGGDNPPKQN